MYIKFGQWLSTRSDILPQPYVAILSNLQDNVPPVSFDKIKTTIENELGPINKLFDNINHKAMSGASLAQTHLAQIHKKNVIVKIKRPEIERIIKSDIVILHNILPALIKLLDPNIKSSINSMLLQFTDTIYEELDYKLELSHLKTIKKNMVNFNNVIIPQVYDNYSTQNIITMEYVSGIKITNIKLLDENKIDRKKLIHDLHKIFFTMLLFHPIFHADPHPGNISVSSNGSLIIYDYGMVGRFDNETRMLLVRLYLAILDKDVTRILNAMYKLEMIAPTTNRHTLAQGLELSIKSLHGKKPTENEINSFTYVANKSMNKFPFILPKNLALYIRMTSMIEGIYKIHNVDFKFVYMLRNVLEEKNILKNAYLDEFKYMIFKLIKSLDSSISLMPELQKLIDNQNYNTHTNNLTPKTIFLSAIFLGSIFIYDINNLLGIIGMSFSILSGIYTFMKH